MAMKITKDMIKRNEKFGKDMIKYCEDEKAINKDGTMDIGNMLYFLGFKIIQQEIKIEKLKNKIYGEKK